MANMLKVAFGLMIVYGAYSGSTSEPRSATWFFDLGCVGVCLIGFLVLGTIRVIRADQAAKAESKDDERNSPMWPSVLIVLAIIAIIGSVFGYMIYLG